MSKPLTTAALQIRYERELCKLLCEVHTDLVRSEFESSERRNALASLENITRAQSQCRS